MMNTELARHHVTETETRLEDTVGSVRYVLARPSYRVIFVLPVFNEEANIGRLLDRIHEEMTDTFLPYHVVAIDDGSSDHSARILDERSCRQSLDVYRHTTNQGLGAALRDGLARASKIAGDKDIIVTMDADNTHTPGLISRMIGIVREGHDVVIASRYRPGAVVAGVPVHRRAVSWLASWLMRILFPTRGVRDYTCGYRAYRAEVVKAAFLKYGHGFVDQSGFQCQVDILLKLRRMGLIFDEAPLVLRYDFKKGASKMRLLRTACDTLRVLLVQRFTAA